MTSTNQISGCGIVRKSRMPWRYATLLMACLGSTPAWGQQDTSASLVRSSSASWQVADTTRALVWSLNPPWLELTWNSALPFSLNDGAQWAGRGATVQASAGVRASFKALRVMLSPTIWFAQNQPFPVLPGASPGRSAFSSPFQVEGLSADIPMRLGNETILAAEPGESAIWVTTAKASVGIATESQWWGPGIRNALVLSNNAGGFAHVFVRTAQPVSTRIGDVEAKWILGGLVESPYFDRDASNDLRSVSGFIATVSPSFQKTLTAGVTRVVFDDASGIGNVLAHGLDPIISGADQINALFARWVFPSSKAEVYGEWARLALPGSLRELLVAPQFTQGFTIGMQWWPRVTERSRLRLQIEMTNLEQSPESRAADTLSYYTSRSVPQGYTHRGQVLGAAIGPGSSSQWLAFDLLRSTSSVGAFLGRIRWNTDAYYTTPQSFLYFSYDATVFAGVRGSRRIWSTDLTAELSFQRRYNFLFQNEQYGYSRGDAFDKNNVTMKLRVN